MRLHTGSQALSLLLLVYFVDKVVGLDLNQCFVDITTNANLTNNLVGLLDGNGYPVSNISDATAISYSLCTSVCGDMQDFQWSVLSQDFSSWLLPYLALISQLPFGARDRWDSFMSAALTVGSPVLAGYSLIVTLLNSRWINRQFNQISKPYPNSDFALFIVSSLQQVPLRLDPDHFAPLAIRPENEWWWKKLSDSVDYTNKWSAASAASISWVIIAYVMSIVNSPSNAFTSTQADGGATSSMWVWLVPIVAGWLVVSPKCDFKRLEEAFGGDEERGSAKEGLSMTVKDKEVTSLDELLTPPVFNYSRSLPWAKTAEKMFQVFKVASEKAKKDPPVNHPEGDRGVRASGPSDLDSAVHPENRHETPEQIEAYCAIELVKCCHWAPGVFTRMALASCASLALQWGTVGGAILIEWFTPTTGLGCRSLSYFIYGAVSTVIWMMLLISSILAHSADDIKKPRFARVFFLALSDCLRRMGKLLAVANAIGVLATCIIQYSDVYNTCICNSSKFSRGAAAYVTVNETPAQAALAKHAWISALVLLFSSVSVFMFLIYLLMDTLEKKPSAARQLRATPSRHHNTIPLTYLRTTPDNNH